MSEASSKRLQVAAIDFLNPAPLMWDFEHGPQSISLAELYKLHYTKPSQCAIELLQGRADLGLIPIAALTPDLAVVPGCAIASLDEVRSIQLIVKLGAEGFDVGKDTTDALLFGVRTIAADTASRSSLAYAQILFTKFIGTNPEFLPTAADPIAMLQQADAALLIGDPALLALEARPEIEAHPGVGPCLWLDLAHQWHIRTGLPWVAAVWAARLAPLTVATASRLTVDLNCSRDHGLAHIDDLVSEWTSRIALPPTTIRHYLTRNIHYSLDEPCIEAIRLFRRFASEAGVLPPLDNLRFV